MTSSPPLATGDRAADGEQPTDELLPLLDIGIEQRLVHRRESRLARAQRLTERKARDAVPPISATAVSTALPSGGGIEYKARQLVPPQPLP
jgi:hypothetical protein